MEEEPYPLFSTSLTQDIILLRSRNLTLEPIWNTRDCFGPSKEEAPRREDAPIPPTGRVVQAPCMGEEGLFLPIGTNQSHRLESAAQNELLDGFLIDSYSHIDSY
jgi:hypothetical protein